MKNDYVAINMKKSTSSNFNPLTFLMPELQYAFQNNFRISGLLYCLLFKFLVGLKFIRCRNWKKFISKINGIVIGS